MTQLTRKEQILKLLKSDPNDSFLLFALAKEFENEDNWVLAKQNYECLLQQNPDYIATYYHYGKLLESLQEVEKAGEIYQTGISKCLDPNDLHSKSELQAALMNLQIG